MKKILTILFGAILITSCGQLGDKTVNVPQTDNSSAKTIILVDTNYAVIKFDGADTWVFKNAKPADLSVDDIKEIEKILSDCVATYKDKLLDLTKYKRQYMPVINDKGEKEIFVNCFCRHWDNDWRKELIRVADGGECYFWLKINLSTKKYYEFMIGGLG